MKQDFDHKISIVINRELPSWQVLNTVAHISGYLGNVLGEQFRTGDNFQTQDGVLYPRNSQYAIIVLSATADQLSSFARSVREANDIQSMFFTREMIETTSDEEIMGELLNKTSNEIELLGVGIFGQNTRVKELTKQFKLWQ